MKYVLLKEEKCPVYCYPCSSHICYIIDSINMYLLSHKDAQTWSGLGKYYLNYRKRDTYSVKAGEFICFIRYAIYLNLRPRIMHV